MKFKDEWLLRLERFKSLAECQPYLDKIINRDKLIMALAERVYAQSELLSRRAEKSDIIQSWPKNPSDSLPQTL